MEYQRRSLFVLSAASTLGLMSGARAAADWFLPWRWRARLLIVFAPGETDRRLQEQRDMLSAASAGAAERDMALLEVVGYHSSDSRVTGSALRLVYRAPLNGFCAVLVGKDGREKMRSEEPVTTDRLFSVIDAMPMRQGEATRSAVVRTP